MDVDIVFLLINVTFCFLFPRTPKPRPADYSSDDDGDFSSDDDGDFRDGGELFYCVFLSIYLSIYI